MITAKAVKSALDKLSLLKFFPSEEGQRSQIGELILAMAEYQTDAQVAELAMRTLRCYNEWPGPLALRAVACSLFDPADGGSATASEVDAFCEDRYLEREAERSRLNLEAAKRNLISASQPLPDQRLISGEVSADPVAERMVERIAEVTSIPKPTAADYAHVRRVHGLDLPDSARETLRKLEEMGRRRPPQVITQADIDRAVQELHQQRKEPDYEPPEAA
jgi:hypothetical protein